jgi:hypothetical protein
MGVCSAQWEIPKSSFGTNEIISFEDYQVIR